jgi:hypothetical protein
MAYVEVNGVMELEVPGVTPFGVSHPYRVGDKIGFSEEKLRYTVQAADGRFLVCNKPLNVRKTVLYCIVDMREQVRGPEDLIFGFGAETRKQCQEMLQRLQAGETEVSYRRRLALDIDRWEKKKK